MTKKVTVYLPDDVAAWLADLPEEQLSGYVAEALRRRHVSDETRRLLRLSGNPAADAPYDPVGARERIAALTPSAESVAQVRGRLAREGLWPR